MNPFQVKSAAFYKRTLFLIFFLSILLRVPGIPWGLSAFNAYGSENGFHPDEFKIVFGAKGYPKDIVVRTDLRYPTGLHYILGILTIPLRLNENFAPALEIDLYYLIGRALIVLVGATGVILCFRLGEKIFSPEAGLLGSAFLATSVYHARNSALALTDVPTATLLLVAALIALRLRSASKPSAFAWLGAALGLLVGVKYTGAFAVIPVGLILLQKWIAEPEWAERKKLAAMTLLAAGVSLLVFVVATPGFVLSFSSFRESLAYELTRTGNSKSSIFAAQTWTHIFDALTVAGNLPFAILSLLGVATAFRRKDLRRALPFALLIPLYFAYFNTSLVARYTLTVMPLLCLFAANLLVDLMRSKVAAIKVTGMLTASALLVYGLAQCFGVAYMLQTDSRYQVAEYLDTQIPPDATIAMGLEESDSCNFSVSHGQRRVLAQELPDYLTLCNGNVLPSDHPYAAEYRLIQDFKPRFPTLALEFISPETRIYKRRE